jgi:hypothetical protein
MKTPIRNSRLYNAWRLVAVLVAASVLPVVAQQPASLPSVSGELTLVNLITNHTLTLHVQAQIVHQGALLLPAGTVLADAPGIGPVLFQVTSLELAAVKAGDVTVATEADITGVDRESGLMLQMTLYKEDGAAAGQLAGDYHAPFPAGDCVTRLQIGDTAYEAACFRLLHSRLEVKALAAQPAP